MFETLTKGFKAARNRLAGVAELSEENIDQALRETRHPQARAALQKFMRG